jgi:hypothetical protein
MTRFAYRTTPSVTVIGSTMRENTVIGSTMRENKEPSLTKEKKMGWLSR